MNDKGEEKELLIRPPFRLCRIVRETTTIWKLRIYLGSPMGDVEVISIVQPKDVNAVKAVELMVTQIKEKLDG